MPNMLPLPSPIPQLFARIPEAISEGYRPRCLRRLRHEQGLRRGHRARIAKYRHGSSHVEVGDRGHHQRGWLVSPRRIESVRHYRQSDAGLDLEEWGGDLYRSLNQKRWLCESAHRSRKWISRERGRPSSLYKERIEIKDN